MKRSDMVAKIITEIKEPHGGGFDPDAISESILKVIEYFGMLPPTSGTEFQNTPSGDRMEVDVNEWEDEDEC